MPKKAKALEKERKEIFSERNEVYNVVCEESNYTESHLDDSAFINMEFPKHIESMLMEYVKDNELDLLEFVNESEIKKFLNNMII